MSQYVNASSNEDQKPVAFFDFDGTLTTSDTLMPFLKFVVGAPTYYTKLALLSPVLTAYFSKMLRNDIAKQIVIKKYLAGYHIDELFEFGKRFSEDVIPFMLRPKGVERLRWHLNEGHECVLVSASMDVYLGSWAESQPFCSTLCTSLEVDDRGYVTGRINGSNCHGKEKLRRIKSLFGNHSPRLKYAYGDSSGDYQMLSYADQSFFLKKGAFVRFRANGN